MTVFTGAERLPIRVASWNIHEGVPMEPDTDPSSEMIHALTNLDAVALQEVALTPDGTFLELAAVAKACGLRHYASFPMSESVAFPEMRMGVALLSRTRLTDVRRTLLPNPRMSVEISGRVLTSHDKGVLTAQTTILGKNIMLGSVHGFPFYLFDRDPREQAFDSVWQCLAEVIDDSGEIPFLIGGDFNTEHRYLLSKSARRKMRRGVTGVPTYRGIESDDLMFSTEFELKGSKVVGTFSDHDLCICEFLL